MVHVHTRPLRMVVPAVAHLSMIRLHCYNRISDVVAKKSDSHNDNVINILFRFIFSFIH